MSRSRRLLAAAAGLAAALSLVLTLAPPSSAAAPTQFLVGTHNTLHGKSGYTAFADVIGWQELDTKAAQNRMTAALPGYAHCIPAGVAGEDSISWRSTTFTAGYCGARLTHGGEAGVTPNRYVVYQVLTVTATGQRFAFVNTHFISGAFSGHPERQARWSKHLGVLQDLAAELQAKGLPVVTVGDFNRHAGVSLHGLIRYSVPGASDIPYDQIYAAAGNKVGDATQLAKNGSDHYAYRGTVSI